MNVKEYFKDIDKIAETDKAAACRELVTTIHEGQDLTSQAMDLIMNRLEELLVGGTHVFASVTMEENGDANYHYIEDSEQVRWLYAILNKDDLANIKNAELFSEMTFLALMDLIAASGSDYGIELIASSDKSITASPVYVKDLESRIERKTE